MFAFIGKNFQDLSSHPDSWKGEKLKKKVVHKLLVTNTLRGNHPTGVTCCECSDRLSNFSHLIVLQIPFYCSCELRERNIRRNLIHQSGADFNTTELLLTCIPGWEVGVTFKPTTSAINVSCVCVLCFSHSLYNLIQAHVCSIQQETYFFPLYSSGLRSPTIWDNASTIFLCIRLAKTPQLSTVFKKRKKEKERNHKEFLFSTTPIRRQKKLPNYMIETPTHRTQ